MPKKPVSDAPQGAALPANSALRDVFGQNLRILATGESSISAACRALGINRTQFNRFLTGTAFPRPDVLYRICTYFGVDARILLEPLAPEREPRMADELARVLHSMVDAPLDFRVDQTLLPSGIYRIWRRSFLQPDRAMVAISRVWRDGLVTRMKSYEPYLVNPRLVEMSRPPRLPCHGLFMRAEDGIMLLTMFPRTRMLRFSYFRQGLAGFGSLFPGYAVLGRDHTEGMLRGSGAVLEHLPAPVSGLMGLARATGFRKASAVPALFRSYLMDKSPI